MVEPFEALNIHIQMIRLLFKKGNHLIVRDIYEIAWDSMCLGKICFGG
jgi:hypothetical protein